MRTFKFNVQGMTCGGCTASVQRALSGLDGVSRVEVTLRPGSATVQADRSRVTPKQIEARLAGVGFEAQAVATD